MKYVEEVVMKRFWALYGEPKTNDPDLFATEYDKALSGWKPDILRPAVDLVIKRHDSKWGWPLPGEITKACNEVLDKQSIGKSPDETSFRAPPVPKSKPLPNETERNRLAREWRDRAVRECGSVDAFLMKHKPGGSCLEALSRSNKFSTRTQRP